MSPARLLAVLLAASLAACFNPSGHDTGAGTTTADSTSTTADSTSTTADSTSTTTPDPTTATTDPTTTVDPTTIDPTTDGTTGDPTCGNGQIDPDEACWHSIGVVSELMAPKDIVSGNFIGVEPGPELLALDPGSPNDNAAVWRVTAGSLATVDTFPIGPSARLATMHLVGDGTPDVVGFGQQNYAFELFKTAQMTDQWSAEAKPVLIGQPSDWLATGAIIGVERRDLVAADTDEVRVWIDPFGTFEHTPTVTKALAGTVGGAIGRFGSDAFNDLALLGDGGSTYKVFPGTGDPDTPFDWATNSLPIPTGRLIVAGDIEGDAFDELVIVTEADNNGNNCLLVSFFPDQGAYQFACGTDPRDVAIAPFATGALLVVADADKSGSLLVLRSLLTSQFVPVATLATEAVPNAIAVDDLDLDGRLDIAVACEGHVEVFLASN